MTIGKRWFSNNDPPIYIWKDDEWYNQKDKTIYIVDLKNQRWISDCGSQFPFTKKTRLMDKKD